MLLPHDGSVPICVGFKTPIPNMASSKLNEQIYPVAQMVRCLPTMQETWVRSLGWDDLLEKEMTTPSSILAWEIPWTEEPGGLPSTGSQRVGHDWATKHARRHCSKNFTLWTHLTLKEPNEHGTIIPVLDYVTDNDKEVSLPASTRLIIHSFNKHWLNSHYGPDTILATGDTRPERFLWLWTWHFCGEGRL